MCVAGLSMLLDLLIYITIEKYFINKNSFKICFTSDVQFFNVKTKRGSNPFLVVEF